MKTKAFFSTIGIFLLTVFCLTSCKKSLEELFSSPSYVNCKLNGEKYAAQYREDIIESFRLTPDFYYNFQNGKGYFNFNFSCYPKKDNSAYQWFNIELCLFLDKPLNIETEYTIAVLPDFHNENIYKAIDHYTKEKQSYCVIEVPSSHAPFRFGNGTMRFTQINNPNEAYMGEFAFVFALTSETQDNDGKEMHLQGNFLITNMDRVHIDY